MTGIGFGGGIDLCEEQFISMGLSVNAMLCSAMLCYVMLCCANVGRERMSSQLAQCNCSEGYIIAGLYSRPVCGLC